MDVPVQILLTVRLASKARVHQRIVGRNVDRPALSKSTERRRIAWNAMLRRGRQEGARWHSPDAWHEKALPT